MQLRENYIIYWFLVVFAQCLLIMASPQACFLPPETCWGFGSWVGPRHRCQTLRLHCWSHPAVAFGRPCLHWRRCEAKGPGSSRWIAVDHIGSRFCHVVLPYASSYVWSFQEKRRYIRSSSSISVGCGRVWPTEAGKGECWAKHRGLVNCMPVVVTASIPRGHMFGNLEEQILISGSGPATHLSIPHLLEIVFLFTPSFQSLELRC